MKRIVGEATKNWPSADGELLSQKFEQMIEVNMERGFTLESWRYAKVIHQKSPMVDEMMISETVIAVFVQCLEASNYPP